VSLALLAFLVWRIDLREAGGALRDADYVYVIPALAIFGIAKLLVSVRWQLMMSKFAALPLSYLFGVLLVSNLANNIVPARIGDLIRVQMPAQRYGVSRGRLAATVFATESLLDGVAFACIGLIGLALINIEGFPTGVFWGLLGGLAGGLIAVIPFSHLRLERGWTERGMMGRAPAKVRYYAEEGIPQFIDGLAVFRDAKLGVQAIALSFAIWLLEVGMFALFGKAFGVTLSMPAWMLITVAANLISAVPIAPSNIGAYEVAMAELMQALGVDEGAAGGFAIATHALNIAWVTVAGFAAMWAIGMRLDDVFSFGGRRDDRGTEALPAAPEPEPG
jgi:uncharacterized protein (TIRG00374 family)